MRGRVSELGSAMSVLNASKLNLRYFIDKHCWEAVPERERSTFFRHASLKALGKDALSLWHMRSFRRASCTHKLSGHYCCFGGKRMTSSMRASCIPLTLASGVWGITRLLTW